MTFIYVAAFMDPEGVTDDGRPSFEHMIITEAKSSDDAYGIGGRKLVDAWPTRSGNRRFVNDYVIPVFPEAK